ncbi:hypothetical protein BCV70DRAFT_110361 [Testicularia cyperi]|uniref:Zn(2)-C6 fungal-type domain-containing protein n=1 Tax=Testicularia cyperi TaxID=1882483 RepID=A0A317XMX7_9BASI|nr:hypothetical protein BCV70DRAFT_110361 [Testicularia cyperi]
MLTTNAISTSGSSRDSSSFAGSASPHSVASSSRCSSVESAGPSQRLTLDDIHIPAGFEVAKGLGEEGRPYPSEDSIQKASEVLKSLRGRMPDGSDGQVAACDYCRRRKIRCDRVKPTCGSCTQSGRRCTTEDMLRKRGPPSKKERAVLEAAGIIFRGTRPHRRRRTATTSLGSGAASKQEELIKQAKEAAKSRVRSHSTDSSSNNTALANTLAHLAQLNGESKSSWMEMLSIASQTSNPFADSPASSPSAMTASDTFNMDAGACDYLAPSVANINATSTAVGGLSAPDAAPAVDSSARAQWDMMWATFGHDLRQKHAGAAAVPVSTDPLPPVFEDHLNMSLSAETKSLAVPLPVFSPYSSIDAGALDWSASNLGLPQFTSPFGTMGDLAQRNSQQSRQQQQAAQVSMAPMQSSQNFLSSAETVASEVEAFQTAMAHFFPPAPAASANASSSASGDAVNMGQFVNTPSTGSVNSPASSTQHQNPEHLLFSLDAALSAF